MENKFTVEEIKNYILSQDSLGDILYNLNADNIRKSNSCISCEENKPDDDDGLCKECRNDMNC